ncbi:MAG: hypothetical protein HC853_15775 [Anaerolineae bacterium]|nr:hypothetical protein [Anaerolineae bacterium]
MPSPSARPGVQTLTVSSANPLYLFNLKVALEWDAQQEPGYLDQLTFNLKRASQYLYDFTNGQMALGDVTVTQNGEGAADANILVRANNRLRPYATQGGIVISTTADPSPALKINYDPGQVTMGASWNRYGTPGQSIGDDWALALAHELGHYLLFQDETYLGLDKNNFITSIDNGPTGCYGSAMGDLYSDAAATEFIFNPTAWTKCQNTLAAKTLKRTEWETMQTWYRALVMPTAMLTGPAILPFDFTNVTVITQTLTQTVPLPDPSFYLDYVGGYGSSGEATAYLLKQDGPRTGVRIVDLGSPLSGQNRVLARGAVPHQASGAPGDTLCVFDLSLQQLGLRGGESGR